jgi:hypothetical protein
MTVVPLDEDGWRLLIRRAFGVPDIVRDDVAIEIISEAVYIPRLESALTPGFRSEKQSATL